MFEEKLFKPESLADISNKKLSIVYQGETNKNHQTYCVFYYTYISVVSATIIFVNMFVYNSHILFIQKMLKLNFKQF